MELTTDIFSQFDKKWALLTAGTPENFNMMTISWGGLGTFGNKPVANVYVRTSRRTHDYVEENELFTISFYPEQYRPILVEMGSKSGRDIDKMNDSGLTAKGASGSVTFEEAEMTLVCRKMLKQPLDVNNMPPEIVDALYTADTAPHDMYIAEVVEILK